MPRVLVLREENPRYQRAKPNHYRCDYWIRHRSYGRDCFMDRQKRSVQHYLGSQENSYLTCAEVRRHLALLFERGPAKQDATLDVLELNQE